MRFYLLPLYFLSIYLFAGCTHPQPTAYKQVHLLEVENDTLTIRDIIFGELPFKKLNKVTSHGLTNHVMWYKLELSKTSNLPYYISIDFAVLDDVQLFWRNKKGHIAHQRTGLQQQTEPGNTSYRVPTFYIEQPPMDNMVYLKVRSQSPLHIPMDIQTPLEYSAHELNNHLLFGILFGCLIIVFVYNLILFFTIREKVYLLYVFYLFAISGVFLHYFGYAFKYFWAYHDWNRKLFPLFVFLTAVTLISFIRQFLNSKKYHPKTDKVIFLLVMVYASATVLLPWLPVSVLYMIGAPGSSIMMILLLIIMIKSYTDSYTPSGYTLVGWFFLFTGAITLMGKTFGILPHNLFTTYYILFGVVIEVVLFNFGLAARLKFLKRKNEEIEQTLKTKHEEIELLRESVASHLLNTSDTKKTTTISKEEINIYLLNELTERELEVLFFVSEGLSNKDIGERLFISTNTVRAHMRKIYEKLYVKNRTEAVYKANQLQLMHK